MSKQYFTYPGPLIHLPEDPPCVIISRGWWSASVSWEPGRLHPDSPALKVFRQRLEDAGMNKAVDNWVEEHFGGARFVTMRQGSVLWGGVHGIDRASAKGLAELVGGYYTRAIEHPLRVDEVAPAQNGGPDPVSRATAPGLIIPWVYFGADHEPFTVIPWTGNTRERVSENLDSLEWEGVAPDDEHLWFSPGNSVLLKPGNRQGSELRRWLAQQRDAIIATLDEAESTSAPSPEPTQATTAEIAGDLVSRIDFPHLRDGGQWRQKDQHGEKFSFHRACHYADELSALGMADADIACLLSDLYWDAVTESNLNGRAVSFIP